MPAAGGTSDPAGQAGPAGPAGAAEQAGVSGAAQPGVPARTIRAIGRPDVRPTAAMLARAFHDDPLMAWILPDERLRCRRLAAFFAVTMRGASLRHEGPEILLTGGQVLGCGNWMPPGTWPPPAWQQLATLPGLARTLRSRLGAASAAYGALIRARPREPHWYLAGLGTDPPESRGVPTAVTDFGLCRFPVTRRGG